MTVKKAIKILLERSPWICEITKIPNRSKNQPRWLIKYEKEGLGSKLCDEMSDREVIKEARIYTSANNHNSKLKNIIKKFDRKNRKIERQLIREEKFDKIPTDKPAYRENPWNWD